ncbi:hypothetical protein ACMHYB_39205 [Sorangium sp. So ce1128]
MQASQRMKMLGIALAVLASIGCGYLAQRGSDDAAVAACNQPKSICVDLLRPKPTG